MRSDWSLRMDNCVLCRLAHLTPHLSNMSNIFICQNWLILSCHLLSFLWSTGLSHIQVLTALGAIHGAPPPPGVPLKVDSQCSCEFHLHQRLRRRWMFIIVLQPLLRE
ncbi:hypothetical protein F2P81_016986 [Scophthalmus maximus]|uniref:Uncharacterized protein n=1 Tax=Scophthalmus maximus TaxID=52904 RepID=A0A6A4SCR3_SCOMX|nr:hypothetical protein F2P81_016986 [Scophthalmus maximus]